MGKIRVRTIGDESQEQEEQKKLKEKREQKKLAKAPGLKGGEKITAVGPTIEELEAEEATKEEAQADSGEEKKEGKKSKKAKFLKAKVIGKRYKENQSLVAKETVYPLSNGVTILKKFKVGKFDETVELHINVKEKGMNGQIALPHGTGKQVRVKVADDALIAEIEKGKIDFDVLVASPSMMPKLAKVARILGPKGLMPNPKTGTITDKPEALIEKLTKGQISYKTEAQAPIIHLSVGKVSFDDKKLEDNIKMVVKTIGTEKISSVTLKSTMSPAIKLNVASSGK